MQQAYFETNAPWKGNGILNIEQILCILKANYSDTNFFNAFYKFGYIDRSACQAKL